MKKRIFLIFVFVLNSFSIFSQNSNSVDSLKSILKSADNKTKVDIYTKLCWKLRNSEPGKAINYGKKAIELAHKINYEKGIVKAYSFTGVAYRNTGTYAQAFDFYYKGLELAKQYNIPEQQGYAYINIGNLYLYQENYKEAIENLKNALKIAKSINNKGMISYCYLNIGRAELLAEKLDLAKDNILNSLEIRKEINDTGKIAVSYKYLADVYVAQNDFNQAIIYYNKSLEGIKKENDLDLLSDIYNKAAILYLNKKQFAKSMKNAQKSLEIAKKIGTKLRIRNAYQTCSDINRATSNYKEALFNLDMVFKYNDSLFNQKLSEKIKNIQYSLIQERKQNQINLLNTEKEHQGKFIFVLGVALVLGVVFLIISFRLNFHKKQANNLLNEQKSNILLKNEELNNQNEEIQTIADSLTEANIEISLQKEEVEKSHQQITSSINYAKRIQTAILPDEDSLSDLFSEHLVFFRAKNIVSGDFYWVKKIRNYTVMAVADCTGHGVPGAFLSMLGITLLNEIIRRNDLSETSAVLDHLRSQIKSSLRQKGRYFENKDGMDFAICAIDNDSMKMQFSGANNPVYIIRKTNSSKEEYPENIRVKIHKLEEYSDYHLIEIKPDRQPIGSYIKEFPFTNMECQLQKDDTIFLFSDGYYDQFNGETGKKFNNGRFRKLLISIADKKLNEQQELLTKTFTDWKLKREQVDDVLVLGVRI